MHSSYSSSLCTAHYLQFSSFFSTTIFFLLSYDVDEDDDDDVRRWVFFVLSFVILLLFSFHVWLLHSDVHSSLSQFLVNERKKPKVLFVTDVLAQKKTRWNEGKKRRRWVERWREECLSFSFLKKRRWKNYHHRRHIKRSGISLEFFFAFFHWLSVKTSLLLSCHSSLVAAGAWDTLHPKAETWCIRDGESERK